jgi:hypothetical protein
MGLDPPCSSVLLHRLITIPSTFVLVASVVFLPFPVVLMSMASRACGTTATGFMHQT